MQDKIEIEIEKESPHDIRIKIIDSFGVAGIKMAREDLLTLVENLLMAYGKSSKQRIENEATNYIPIYFSVYCGAYS
jgi:hypothetical protein